ncbi:hypothetical protein P6166_03180 [Stenotrophomonas sp. HITSZ_GD]|uniref:hypothetical protein n=1 Tax=Stenotrophomonas sp. HITSZ_GD TaxID=3037248 RepID=UPI00240DCE87|nr:hypothetical protein [Stenotrophomonas sp. HITSZ_GD]MDG2524363.1 hypothetical protein [Stenotrophomonas sp. HITSZ_GD]
MQWFLPILISLSAVHVLAIILGGRRRSWTEGMAMASGILGLLSIPAALLAIAASLCIAGGCNRRGTSPDVIAVAITLALGVSSAILAVALSLRWLRARMAQR